MTETTNRRHENRVSTSVKADYSFGRVDGVGTLTNISYSGALIEDISTRPPEIGTRIVLCVYLIAPRGLEEVAPFELDCHVARHSSTGFAVTYEDNHDPDVRGMLEVAAAIAAASRGAPEGNPRPDSSGQGCPF
jgi:hypothetical protein